MNILKKKRIRLVIFLLVFAFFFIFNKETYAKSYSIENMQISANLLDNGDLQVNQKIEYKFNGAYNGIYIDIPCDLDDEKYNEARKQNTIFEDSLYNGDNVTIKSVKVDNINFNQTMNAKNGEKGVYTTETNEGILRLKVFAPSSNENKVFNISYTIENVAVVHNDIGELYYNFIGGNWETIIKELNITIALPKNEDKLYAFAHGPYNGVVDILNNNVVQLNVSNIKKGDYVAARILFNKNNIAKSQKQTNKDALSIILKEEKDIYDNIENKNKFTMKVVIFGLILLAYWLVLILIYEKEKRKDYPIDEEELFKKYNPLIAGCIQGSREILARDIIAVVLNLIEKKNMERRNQ